jgi:hypothetical protein
MEFRSGGSVSDAQRWADRRHRVVLGNDEQNGAANGGSFSYRPVSGYAEE